MRTLSRRDWFGSAAIALGAARAGDPEQEKNAARQGLDIHVHLFGTGDAGSGCRLSKKITHGIQFQILARQLGLDSRAKTRDESYVLALVEHAEKSSLAKLALVGQDAVYDAAGKPDWERTNFYVPADYVLKIGRAHADRFIPCPGLNPDRRDAVAELDRLHGEKVRAFKIHPPTTGCDLADPKHAKFFARAAALKFTILVHTGHEHSAPVLDKALADPARLERALDAGCVVVACHAGTGWPTDRPDQVPAFLKLAKRHANFYGDTSVLGSMFRARDFYRLLDDPAARERLVHGSDFPFPVYPRQFSDRIGRKQAGDLAREPSLIEMDYKLKAALGIGAASAAQGMKLLFAPV